MINYIGCLLAAIIGILLGNVDSISEKDARILTIIGWAFALYYTKEVN